MATWEDIKIKLSRTANKSLRKAGELADTASLHIKLKTVAAKLSDKYEKLGRLTYRQLKSSRSEAEAIAKLIEEIDALRAEALAIKTQIEEEKKAREEKAKEEKAYEADFEECSSDTADEAQE